MMEAWAGLAEESRMLLLLLVAVGTGLATEATDGAVVGVGAGAGLARARVEKVAARAARTAVVFIFPLGFWVYFRRWKDSRDWLRGRWKSTQRLLQIDEDRNLSK